MHQTALCLVLSLASVGCITAPKLAPPERDATRFVSAASDQTFRVMTLNIAHARGLPQLGGWVGVDTQREFLEAIGVLIRRERPSVVAMQEVHRPIEGERGLNHLALIRTASGYADGFYGPHLVAAALGREQGTALLSRTALGSPSSKVLNLEQGDDKGFVRATVRVPELMGREIDVVSVHLDPYSERKRMKQVQWLADDLRGRTRPVVVMGDFNARYQGPFRALGRLLTLTRLRAWQLTGGKPTYPAGWPKVRIDWILISPELEFVDYRNVNEGVSDHQGVIAELRLAGQEVQMATTGGGGELGPAAVR